MGVEQRQGAAGLGISLSCRSCLCVLVRGRDRVKHGLGGLGEVEVRERKARALMIKTVNLLLLGATLCCTFSYGVPFCMSSAVYTVLCLVMIGFFHYPVEQFRKSARGVIMTPTSNGVMIVRRISRGRCFRSHELVMSVFVDLMGMRTG